MEQPLNSCPVRYQACLQPDAIAITTDYSTISYRELDQYLESLTTQFLAHKITIGDRLVCISTNALKLILLQLSCLRSGIIFCPINPRFSKNEIQTRLSILDSAFIWFETISAPFGVNSLALDFNFKKSCTSNLRPLIIDSQQVINIIFTSGSSGKPKAVMHNFSNHFYSALGSQTTIPLHRGDKNLLSLPIFHISGYATVIRTILAGATLIISEQRLNVALLNMYKITHLSLVSTQLRRLLSDPKFKQKEMHLKHLLLGGSSFPEQLLRQTRDRNVTYHLSYGLTEMSSQVATSSNDQCLSILPNREVKIVNNEIFLRGKTRFVGYFNKRIKKNIIPEQQWFASKDLGNKDANQLQIIGRKDRQFISGGENIQPEEIERLLVKFAAVEQAYVVAIDDPSFGKRPVAFIAWREGRTQSKQLDDYIQQKLASYKCPIHYFELAQQTNLKVSLTDLQKQAIININKLTKTNSAGERLTTRENESKTKYTQSKRE